MSFRSEIQYLESLGIKLCIFGTCGWPILDDYGCSRTNTKAFESCGIKIEDYDKKGLKLNKNLKHDKIRMKIQKWAPINRIGWIVLVDHGSTMVSTLRLNRDSL